MGKPSGEDLFAGHSEMAALLRSQFAGADEGAQLPLRAIATGSPSLKNALGILLNACCPIFLVWDCNPSKGNSSDRILFYNDAYLACLKETQHLIPCGRSIRESWTEDWRDIQSDVEQVFQTGQPLRREKEPFPTDRTGYGQLYTWSYSALWDEASQIRGVFATGFVSNIVDRKQAEAEQERLLQELAAERAQFEAVLRQMPEGVIIAAAASEAMILSNERTNQILQHSFELNLELGDYDQNAPFQAYHTDGHVYAPDDYPLVRSLRTGEVVTHEEIEIHHANGNRMIIDASSSPILDSKGNIISAVVLIQDITERKRAEKALERYQLLSEYSRDIVLYVRSDGQILEANQAAVQAYGYDRTTLLTLKLADLRTPETLPIMPAQFEQAIRRGILFETVHRRQDGTDFPVEVNAQSAVIDGETVLLSVIRNITERKQAELEREQLLVREQAAREAAEAAAQRASFLAEVSTTLNSSLDYAYTLSSVAQAVVPTLADWCAIDILKDGGTLERLATAHIDPAKVQWGRELHRRYPPDLNAPHGLAHVLRTGQSSYYPIVTDDQIAAAARDADHLKILRAVGMSSVMLVPLNARGKTLGAISFVAAESGRSYSPDDLSLAEELARRSALALDNARLYQAAQQARQAAERAADRTARLQTVTAALSESLTPEQVAAVIVEQSMATLEAAAALVVLVSDDRTELEIVKAVGYQADLVESWRTFSINADVPLAEAIRTGEPVWVEALLERLARYPHLAEIYSRYDFQAWIAIPLVVEGSSVGGMLLSFKEFKHLDTDDRAFVLALTRQCAQAIVRAQLYKAEQQARAEAERVNRIKDEFLAVLSHELRSPLNPILGWARLLQTHPLDEAGTQRALETIERNAKLQTQLIDDLLDVSRILRGKLVLHGYPTNLVHVIDAACETVRLSAEAKGIDIQKVIDSEIGLTLGDASRLQQVVWNLLSNAVKFTPDGGQIEIRLEQVEREKVDQWERGKEDANPSTHPPFYTYAQVQVRDTGKGINSAFLPHVFEYFRQEDGATTRRFGGLGLGLAIVRQIVELHGGTVTVASPGEGQGATFTVQIPLAPQLTAQAACKPTSETPLDLNGLRILVVDDDADSRELITFVLEQARATVTSVTSGMEALQCLDQAIPDLVVSDIGMPEMDGYMLMQQIRERGQTVPALSEAMLPAIALTAYASESNQKQALAAGFQEHLPKPVEPDTIVRAIAHLVNRNPKNI